MFRRKLNYFSITVVLLLFMILIKDLHQSNFFITITKILKPFVYGFVIAYVLNPIIQYLERKLNFKKGFSIGLVYTILIFMLYIFFTRISPKLVWNINNLIVELPQSLSILLRTIGRALSNLNSPVVDRLFRSLVMESNEFLLRVTSPVSLNIEQVFSLTVTVTGVVTNVVIGIVVSIYMIKDKSRFANLGKKLIYAFLQNDEATSIVNFLSDLNLVFSRFIVGKIIDSAIMALLCFVPLKLMGAPLTLLISLIFGVTNIVPYFGPLLGIIIISFMSLVYMPELAVPVIVLIVLLQQFDGLYLGPKILGGKVGLSTFWTMTTILISGGLFGVIGMLLAVPTASVVRKLLNKAVEDRLENKKIKIH